MLVCNECRASYDSLLFCCPSCGVALITCVAHDDTVVFRGGTTFHEVRAIAIKGRIQSGISSATMTARGFEVASTDGAKAQMTLLQLYESLNSASEVIEL